MAPKHNWPVEGRQHPDGLMTVAEVAARLRCSPSLVYALIESGELACYRIGLGKQGGIRISEQQLVDYLNGRQSQGLPQGQPLKHLKLN